MTNYDKFFKKHWEVLSYLVFGVLCTLLNIVLYALFNKLFGYTAANSWGNVPITSSASCLLTGTNRAFVFQQNAKAMAREFGAFVTCRLAQCCWTLQLCWCWAICWLRRVQR